MSAQEGPQSIVTESERSESHPESQCQLEHRPISMHHQPSNTPPCTTLTRSHNSNAPLEEEQHSTNTDKTLSDTTRRFPIVREAGLKQALWKFEREGADHIADDIKYNVLHKSSVPWPGALST
jgi:hypothetical protein